MARRQFSNVAIETTLANGIGSADSSLTVADSTGYPNVPFLIVIDPGTSDEELIEVGGKSGTTFSSLTRGADGTSAAAHSAGATVKHVYSASDMDRMFTHFHGGDEKGDYTQVHASAVASATSVDLNTINPTEETVVEGTIVIPSNWNTYDIQIFAAGSRELYFQNASAEYYFPRLYYDGAVVEAWDFNAASTVINFGADVSGNKVASINEGWLASATGLTATGSRNFKWTGALSSGAVTNIVFANANIICNAFRVT